MLELLVWAGIILACSTIVAGVSELLEARAEARARRRRIQRLRERRRYADSLEPRRWA